MTAFTGNRTVALSQKRQACERKSLIDATLAMPACTEMLKPSRKLTRIYAPAPRTRDLRLFAHGAGQSRRYNCLVLIPQPQRDTALAALAGLDPVGS